MLALLVALSGPPAPPPPPSWYGGRIVTLAGLHVGVRPAVFIAPGEMDFGITLQLTTRLF